MTSPAVIVFCLVDRWAGGFYSEKPCNILHALDFHIVKVVREIQQIHVCPPRKGEVAVEALPGRSIIPSNREFPLDLVGSLDQVGPVECVTPKRENNVWV